MHVKVQSALQCFCFTCLARTSDGEIEMQGSMHYLQLLRGEREGNQSTATGGHIAGCQGSTPHGVPVRLGF